MLKEKMKDVIVVPIFDPKSIARADFFDISLELKKTKINAVNAEEDVRIMVSKMPRINETW